MHYAYATLVSRQPEIFSRRVSVEAIVHAHWRAPRPLNRPEKPMPSRFIFVLIMGLGLLVATLPAVPAAEPSGYELVEHVERLLWGKTNQGVSEMTVTTPRWTRTLKLRFWMDRPRYTLIRILAPPKEQGIGSLRIQAEMWNYLPKVARIIKIPSSMMLQPWMGSDFSNDDLVKESSMVEDYTHALLGTEKLDGVPAYRVQSIPKPDAAVVWGKLVYFIRVTDRMPLKQEYYDERGELIKTMTFGEVRALGGRVIPTRWSMQPLAKPGNRTLMVIREMTFDRPIDPGFFSLANLQNPRE